MIFMETESMREEIAAQTKRARQYLDRMKSGQCRDSDAFYACLRGYTLARFLLTEEETAEEIAELAAKSMAKLLHIPVETLKQNDKPSGCTYATSVSDKKILLIMSLTKALNVTLFPRQVPEIRTLGQLSALLWEEQKSCAHTGTAGDDENGRK